MVRGVGQRVNVLFVGVFQPEFNVQKEANQLLIFYAIDEDGDPVDNRDGAAIGVPDHGHGAYQLLGVGGWSHPQQKGGRGQNHHRADRYIMPLDQCQECRRQLRQGTVLYLNDSEAIPPPHQTAERGGSTDRTAGSI